MQIPCNVQVTFGQGAAPGTLTANVQLVGLDGTVYQSDESSVIRVGETLAFGPVLIEVQISASVVRGAATTPAVQPGKPGQPGAPAKPK